MKLEVLSEIPASAAHATPILFVHGMWHGAWCWAEHFLPYFAQHGYAAYALSLRGHGASEGREKLRWTSLAKYVVDVAQAAAEIKTTPVLVGHSMGGLVVQKYLESHQAPAAVLLASAPPTGLGAATLRVARRHPSVFLKGIVTMSLYHNIATPQLCREVLFSENLPEQELQKCYARMQDESYRAYLDMVLLDLPKTRLVKASLLVLGAEKDSAISRREVEATARAYGTQAEFFTGMAHDMMLEAGWQSVADRIINWLAERKI
jgi:alpha-beta hydrolase superfamily lysophospholipase